MSNQTTEKWVPNYVLIYDEPAVSTRQNNDGYQECASIGRLAAAAAARKRRMILIGT